MANLEQDHEDVISGLLNGAQVADIFHIGKASARRLMEDGSIAIVSFCRAVRVQPEDSLSRNIQLDYGEDYSSAELNQTSADIGEIRNSVSFLPSEGGLV